MFPFQLHNGRRRLIDQSVLNYTLNYYVHDFMKSNDPNFPSEFGYRFEKFIELGLKELNVNYIPEVELKKMLVDKSNLVDFVLPEDRIFIECKAIEIHKLTAINPTDEFLYNSMKGSILKAYFKQLIGVSAQMNPESENWGVILTYKEIFWSQYTQLYHLGEGNFDSWGNVDHMPPENVFIIDLDTWGKIIEIVKSGQASLLELLKLGKRTNANPETMKQSFYMHLDDYKITSKNLSYLLDEHKLLEFPKKTKRNLFQSKNNS